jgi:hypothetical protein
MLLLQEATSGLLGTIVRAWAGVITASFTHMRGSVIPHHLSLQLLDGL